MIGEVHHLGHAELAARLAAAGQRVDLLCVDAPYSAVTHAGHDSGAVDANRGKDYRGRKARPGSGTGPRRSIVYPPWTSSDVEAFVDLWEPLTSGWFVSITDDELAHTWKAELRNAGRYVFAPIPLIEVGGRVRLVGDGPSSWACWVIVARPMSGEWLAEWRERKGLDWRGGTLRGLHEGCDELDSVPAYYKQAAEGKDVVGGKPLRAMRSIIADYSLPGDIVCDPCCGGGSGLVAAKMAARKIVGGDIDAEHVAIARRRIDETPPGDLRGTPIGGARGQSLALFGGGT